MLSASESSGVYKINDGRPMRPEQQKQFSNSDGNSLQFYGESDYESRGGDNKINFNDNLTTAQMYRSNGLKQNGLVSDYDSLVPTSLTTTPSPPFSSSSSSSSISQAHVKNNENKQRFHQKHQQQQHYIRNPYAVNPNYQQTYPQQKDLFTTNSANFYQHEQQQQSHQQSLLNRQWSLQARNMETQKYDDGYSNNNSLYKSSSATNCKLNSPSTMQMQQQQHQQKQQNFLFKTPSKANDYDNRLIYAKNVDSLDVDHYGHRSYFKTTIGANQNNYHNENFDERRYRFELQKLNNNPHLMHKMNLKTHRDGFNYKKYSDDDEEHKNQISNQNTDAESNENDDEFEEDFEDDGEEDEFEEEFESDDYESEDEEKASIQYLKAAMANDGNHLMGKVRITKTLNKNYMPASASNSNSNSQMNYPNDDDSSFLSNDRKQNRKRQKGELVCQVCGANANGYNFDAITCESCKAFFRRNAFRNKNEFRCINNQKCVITINTRKKCKKCRIEKCFEVGMRSDWIMSETEREEKRRKIEENRRKKALKLQYQIQHGPNELLYSNDKSMCMQQFNMNGCVPNNLMDSINESKTSTNNQPNGNIHKPIRRRRRRRRRGLINTNNIFNYEKSNQMQQESQQPAYQQIQHSAATFSMFPIKNQEQTDDMLRNQMTPLREQSYKSSALINQNGHNMHKSHQAHQALNIPSVFNSSNLQQSLPTNDNSMQIPYDNSDIYETFSSDDYESTSSDDSVNENNYSRVLRGVIKLTNEEEAMLTSIETAYNAAVNAVFPDPHAPVPNPPDIESTLNVTELAVRRLVNFFKFNDDFKSVTQDAQTILLKGCMMELLLIHGAIAWNPETNTFSEPGTNGKPFSAESLKRNYGEEKYNRIMHITKSLAELTEGNKVIVKIMLFVVLFKLGNDGLSPRDEQLIQSLNMKYTKFLHNYMRYCFKYPQSDLKFSNFALLLSEINTLGNSFRHIVIEASNPKHVQGLMKEVFLLPDVKPDREMLDEQIRQQQQKQQQQQAQQTSNTTNSNPTQINDNNYVDTKITKIENST